MDKDFTINRKFISIREEVTNQLCQNLASKFDELFLQGLNKKGFEFKNRIETEDFIKSRCRCEDNVQFKQRIYFVDNIPFLLHDYKIDIDIPLMPRDIYKVTANYGKYAFL